MKTIVDETRRDLELRGWSGADAQIWMYHASLRRLALLLSRPQFNEMLYVIGVGCRRMTGPFSWHHATVSVSISAPSGPDELPVCRVMDTGAQFELECTSVVLVRAPATDYDTTFDGFLGDSERRE